MDGFQERKWFVYQNDHHEGPFSLEEIQDKMGAGEVQRSQYVWCQGMSDWQMMSAVRDFEGLLATPAAAQPVHPTHLQIEPEASPAVQAESLGVSLEIQHEPAPEEATHIGISIEEPKAEAQDSPSVAPLEIVSEPEPELALEPETPADIGAQPEAPRRSGFLRVFLTLSLVGLGSYAYLAGHLDPVVKNPGFVKAASAVRGVVQPGLTRIAQWVPALQILFSPIGDIEGVQPEELRELRAAAVSKIPGTVGLAVLKDELLSPTLYVAANLPNGTVLDVRVEGVPDTLVSQTSLSATTQVTLEGNLARTDPVRQLDGRPLVQGQYWVQVTPADDAKQSSDARQALAGLPAESKIAYKKAYFLGGRKDDSYSQRLKEFHDRLARKSTDELHEIRQYFSTLDLQLQSTNREYDQASSNKVPKAGAKAWNAAHSKWTRLQTQLESGFSKWTDGLSRGEYYQASLYELTRQLGDHVSQLHTAQHALMTNKGTNKAQDQVSLEVAATDLAQKRTAAAESLASLRSELERVEKLPPSANGMPQR